MRKLSDNPFLIIALASANIGLEHPCITAAPDVKHEGLNESALLLVVSATAEIHSLAKEQIL